MCRSPSCCISSTGKPRIKELHMNSEPAYVRPTTSRNLLPTGRSAGYRVCRVTRLFAVAHVTAVANFSDSLLLWPQLRRYCVSSNLKYIALNVCIHLSVLGQTIQPQRRHKSTFHARTIKCNGILSGQNAAAAQLWPCKIAISGAVNH